jgi:predicted 2-oxoglutarate/Fe(II)-dependent dioxygenase YbiX
MTNKIFVVNNFIDELCAKSIISEINQPSETNAYPDHYLNRNGGTALPYNNNVLKILKKYSDKSNQQIKELFNLNFPVYTTKGYSSKWQKGSKGDPHIDNVEKETFIEWSTVIYLNEPPEFDGGIIYFPKKDFEYVPVKYSAVFFPQQDDNYIHGITEVTGGERYTLLFHHSSKIEFADPDLLGDKYAN